ncbi:MAG: helix-turn-helix domain-containing protein [Haloferacaceae archaeon]
MSGTDELLEFAVDVWHPDCWTLRTTRDRDAGVLGHGMAVADGRSTGRYTVYGDSGDAVDALVEDVRASPLTASVSTVPGARTAAGQATRGLLVECDAARTIRTAFADRGFVHRGPTRHEAGVERRTLLARTDRETVRRALDDVARSHDADVDLARLTATPRAGGDRDRLSPRQREALDLARARGYYAYPRETDAGALAAEMGVTKSTYLEHLRKAEAKVLGSE